MRLAKRRHLASSLLIAYIALAAFFSSPNIRADAPPTRGVAMTTQTSISTVVTISPPITVTQPVPGRHTPGGVPPGLVRAWANSNMSVVARAVTSAIFLGGTRGVQLAQIAIKASSSNQIIRNIAFNESVLQILFDQDGAVVLSAISSVKPAAVYADDLALLEAQAPLGLSPSSEAWFYDQANHTLAVFADPGTITLFYGSVPIPEFPLPSALVGVAVIATVTVVTRSQLSRRTK